MASISNWMHVDIFTVDQAAALWCGHDPTMMKIADSLNPSEVVATKQMLVSGILNGTLKADVSTNALRTIGNHSSSLVSRGALEQFAKQKSLFPRFLFDVLAPFPERSNPFQAPLPWATQIDELPSPAKNQGGRPPEYDWDSFMMEIVSRANSIDGLPETQADLIRDLLSWFSETYGREPAESAVKQRVSRIYKYLAKAKNL